MSDWITLYGEAGAAGIVALLLVFLVVSLSRKADRQQQALEAVQQDLVRISTALRNTESITIKLVDRFNSSDLTQDARTTSVVATLTGLRGEISYIRGRISAIATR